ncbi:hypothetical protein [Paracoccus spongiarum]|uniref:Sulfotransferase family protein n=1 Tax=Paracoccus spongiarum TaxID=3064387 RepID=A0ABT9JC89_9RHOB|nr:hypothetical protein [Paracoccus sp. 2205BS29-5]MDP5307431.1 hypothetical protein [Paracoccus sp. 2205BS29-5]
MTTTDLPSSPAPAAAFDAIRADRATPRSYFVMGERASGTNYLQWVIRENMQVRPIALEYWKHGFPTFDMIPEHLLIVVSYRNALSWLLSLYTSPWHASPQMQALGFSEFIRCPWETVIDNRFMRRRYQGTPMIGRPLQADRHPITGRAFENVLRMRTAKMQALEGLRNRRCNVVYTRQEDVLKDTGACLDALCRSFGLSRRQAELSLPTKRLGGWPEGMKREAPKRISDDDLAFIRSQLDLGFEARLGYHY